MGINYETAGSYLESTINNSIETSAEELATATAKRDAEKITKNTFTAANTHGDDSIIACDLLSHSYSQKSRRIQLERDFVLSKRNIKM